MYKVIEIKNRNILINVNNISQICLVDDKITFHLNNSFTITVNVQSDVKKLYNDIKTFILNNQSNIMQIY